jgi:hypothetical protein
MSMGINNVTTGVTAQQTAYASKAEKNTNNTEAAEKQSTTGQWSYGTTVCFYGKVRVQDLIPFFLFGGEVRIWG